MHLRLIHLFATRSATSDPSEGMREGRVFAANPRPTNRPRLTGCPASPVGPQFDAAVPGADPVAPPRLSHTFGSSWAWRL